MNLKNHFARFIFLAAMAFSFSISHAQSDTIYYYMDKDFNKTTQPNASYQGLSVFRDSMFRFTITNMKTGIQVFNGSYIDVTLQIPDGRHDTFNEDGQLAFSNEFKKGKKTGLWKSWNYGGLLTDSALYENDEPLFSYSFGYTDAGKLRSYSSNDLVTKKKTRLNYSEDGILLSEGNYTGLAGTGKSFYASGKISVFTEYDENGKIIVSKHYTQDGKEISEKEFFDNLKKKFEESVENARAKAPEFRGGDLQFESFIQKNLKLPVNLKNSIHEKEEIYFSFMLNESGGAYDVKLISPPGVELEMAIEQMLRAMPAWKMKGFKSFGPVYRRVYLIY
ncbi:MAG TPA: hypothetical protein VLJ68_14240 [Chitinophagaceae bacterium]|nr:hypothetical protein [Chitinophagaceae bacterium]